MTKTSISIIKELRKILLSNVELKNLVGERIFPIVADVETNYPFIVIKRNSLTVNYTKDILLLDENLLTFSILAEDYEKAVNIAELVRITLENKKTDFIKDCRIRNVSDSFNNVFVIEITFDIKTN